MIFSKMVQQQLSNKATGPSHVTFDNVFMPASVDTYFAHNVIVVHR